MSIMQSLRNQYQITQELGTSVYQFALSRKDVMDLGFELLSQHPLPVDSADKARNMAFSSELGEGMLFMGVPLVARGK